MKKFLSILFFLCFGFVLSGQSDIAKGAGVWYSYGVPTSLPDTTSNVGGTELCYDVLNGDFYGIDRSTYTWVKIASATSDQHFFNTDLASTGNRSHSLGTNSLVINGQSNSITLKETTATDTTTFAISPGIMSGGITFTDGGQFSLLAFNNTTSLTNTFSDGRISSLFFDNSALGNYRYVSSGGDLTRSQIVPDASRYLLASSSGGTAYQMGLGHDLSSVTDTITGKGWYLRRDEGSTDYDFFHVDMSYTSGLIHLYDNSYQLPNSIPSTTLNDTTFMIWRGTGSVAEPAGFFNIDNIGGGVTDHGALTGLTNDDHTQYALLLGRSGGQTLIGGTASEDDLILSSTSNATKGLVSIANTLYIEESTGRVGLGTDDPTNGRFHMTGTSSEESFRISNTSTGRAKLHLEVEPGGNDSYLHWDVNGTRNYVFGIDNSDSDKLVLRASSDPSSGTTALSINSTGELALENLTEDNTLDDVVVVDANNIAHSRDISTFLPLVAYGERILIGDDTININNSSWKAVKKYSTGGFAPAVFTSNMSSTDSTLNITNDGKYEVSYSVNYRVNSSTAGCDNIKFRVVRNGSTQMYMERNQGIWNSDVDDEYNVSASRFFRLFDTDTVTVQVQSSCASAEIIVANYNFTIKIIEE